MAAPVLAQLRPVFRAIATAVVPEASRLDEHRWAAVEGIVERALLLRPPPLRRQLGVFIRLVQWLPVLRFGRPFTRLDPGRRARVLAAIQNAPVLVLRRGFWGLKTLILMGYYARPEAAVEIGYRAYSRGWEARR